MMLTHAHRRRQRADPEPARPAGGVQGADQAQVPQLPGGQHAVQRDGQPPRVQHRRLVEPEDVGGRRHGGAPAASPSSGSRRPAARSSRATACPRPRRRPAATRPTAPPTPAPSACRSRRPSSSCSTTTATRCRRAAGRDRDQGPQVMAGYWQRPDETAKVMTADGFFRTGDVGIDRRARLLQDRRPQEGHGAGQRLQRLPERGRGRGLASCPACSSARWSACPTRSPARRSSS